MHLNLNADDDGFVAGTAGILKKLSVSRRELQLLKKHGYLTLFPSGVVLINHWLLHNQIRQDSTLSCLLSYHCAVKKSK